MIRICTGYSTVGVHYVAQLAAFAAAELGNDTRVYTIHRWLAE